MSLNSVLDFAVPAGFSRSRVFKAGALACLGFAGLSAGAQAQNFDDRPSTFEPLWNIIGTATDDERPPIDFRERPKIVVPKTMALPPPQEGKGKQAANWPRDPDLERREQVRKAARAPREISVYNNPVIRNQEMLNGRTNEPGSNVEVCTTRSAGAIDCSAPEKPSKFSELIQGFTGSKTDEDAKVLIKGKEPERRYLTEPPRGYRSGAQTVKAGGEQPRVREDYADPRAYIRKEANRGVTNEE